MASFYPLPEAPPQRRSGRFTHPQDGRLKMHPRVESLASRMINAGVGEEFPIDPEYAAHKHSRTLVWDDARRLKERFGLDGVYRFSLRRMKGRRTA